MATTAHGNKAVIKLDSYAGTLVALTAYEATAAFDFTVESDSDPNFGARADDHTIGLNENGSVPLGGPYSSTKLRHFAGIWQSASTKTLEVNPGGAATGRRKQTAETILTSIEVSSDLNATSQMNTEHKLTGAVTAADN